MFARVTTLQLKPAKLDEFLCIFQDLLAPVAAAQPNFGGLTLLTDSQLGKVVVFELWDSEADRRGSDRAYYQIQLAQVGDLLAGPPLRDSYEVGLQIELDGRGMARIRGI